MTGEWRNSEDCPDVEEYYVDGVMRAWLQKRPHYCDRGHWQVNADVPHMDGADGFPRYYMRYGVAKAEAEAFIAWRLNKVRAEEKYFKVVGNGPPCPACGFKVVIKEKEPFTYDFRDED